MIYLVYIARSFLSFGEEERLFDYILLSDVLYLACPVEALTQTILQFCSSHTIVLLSVWHRYVDHETAALQYMRGQGLEIVVLTTDPTVSIYSLRVRILASLCDA